MLFSRWKLALETSANFVATRAGKRRWIPARVSRKCVMGIKTTIGLWCTSWFQGWERHFWWSGHRYYWVLLRHMMLITVAYKHSSPIADRPRCRVG